MAGIMDFFKPRSEIDANNAAITGQANANAAANQQPGASAVPDTSNQDPKKIPGSVATPPNPLDVYAKMLDNAKTGPDTAPVFAIDPKTLDEVASTMDFVNDGVPKELMEKAMTGDVAAMMEVIQHTARNSYKHALSHQAKLTDAFLGQRSTFDDAKIAKTVNSGLVKQSLHSVANYSHPVAKAELNRAAEAYQASHPDASPQQVAEAAHKYLTDLAEALNPSKAAPGKDTNGEKLEMDWSMYLRSDQQ